MRLPVAWYTALATAAFSADIAEFAEPLDAERVDPVVRLRHEDDVDRRTSALTGIRYSARFVLT